MVKIKLSFRTDEASSAQVIRMHLAEEQVLQHDVMKLYVFMPPVTQGVIHSQN